MIENRFGALVLLSIAPSVISFSTSRYSSNVQSVPSRCQTYPKTRFSFRVGQEIINSPCHPLYAKPLLSKDEVQSDELTLEQNKLNEISGNNNVVFTANMPFFSNESEIATSSLAELSNNVDNKVNTDNTLTETNSSTASSTQPGEGILWRGVIVILCALWASNFAAGKLIMSEPGVDSSLYVVARFSIALLTLIPGSISDIRRGLIDWDTIKGAAVCGSWVSFGYLGQTLGLLTTTASRSCVICTLHCVFVAVIAELWRVNKAASVGENKSFDLMRLVPAAIAVLGVAIVELKGAGGAPTVGDLLSFAQPIGFGMGYLQLEQLMRKKPDAGLSISAIKLVMITFFSFGMFELYPILQHEAFTFRIPDFSPILSSKLALGGVLYTGIITTSLSLWVESLAFKRVPATDASIILTTEPLFAALAGAITLGETFGASDYFGATLIIGACALAILMDKDEGNDVRIVEENAPL